MDRKKCIIIRSNALDRDVRIPKEIAILEKKYSITFIGWNRDLLTDQNYLKTQKIDQKLLNFKAPYGKLILLYLPLWWLFIFYWLLIKKWDVAHVINFDSAIPVIVVSKIKNKKVIYEVLDTYEDSMVLPEILRIILMQIDKFFLSMSDCVILADDKQNEEFHGIPNKNIITIYDSPPDAFTHLVKRNDSLFILFYAGSLYKDRNLNLDKIIEAIKDIDKVKVVIAGYGDLVQKIQEYEKEMPEKVQFIGKIGYNEVMVNIQKSDLLFVLRDSTVLINKYICGSTLLNAMMCGKPIMVNDGTSTAQKVIEEKCGLIIDADNIKEIKQAIIQLRDDPRLYELLSKNARAAYEKKYNWVIMEKRLLELYKNLG
jgi:glycosyltransferase involved in cell wall biosynthesis